MRFKNQVFDWIWLGAIGISFLFWVAMMIDRWGWRGFFGILLIGLIWQRVLGR